MYDIFYASKNNIDVESWLKIKDTYPTAQKVENVKSFNDLNSRAFTKMFWVIWDDLELTDNVDLMNYRATEWDNMYVHVFKNQDFFDGICLFPKNKKISQREFDYRFFIDKKEIDIIASIPKLHDKFIINTYDDYLLAIKTSTTSMFWASWSDIEINNNFKFNYQVPKYNQDIVHVFKNGDHYDGICIFPTSNVVSKKEFINRFFIKKKEIDIVASFPTNYYYDVVFISYNEPNADNNYNNLLKKFPNAKRVHGVKGIHQAHIAAANLATTEMFYVVDGDAELVIDFNFNIHIPIVFRDHVHVWRSRNPINSLIYGYGGIKLLPRDKTINMDISKTDMTTSISSKFKAMPTVSNITAFNTDPFNTWKSAFRECTKLSSKIIDRQKDDETAERLQIWCNVGKDKPFGKYAIAGALAGKEFGEANRGNLTELKKINDFDWLKEQYEQRAKNICS
jgi:hypothetical protein